MNGIDFDALANRPVHEFMAEYRARVLKRGTGKNMAEMFRPRQQVKALDQTRSWHQEAHDVIDGVENTFPHKKVIAVVAEYFGISHEAFMSDSRLRKHVVPRHIFYWIARHYSAPKLGTFPKIAFSAGYRDHTTVINGVQFIDRNMGTYAEDIAAILTRLRGE
jgi:chromosomal replication initiation ATPase DnaA